MSTFEIKMPKLGESITEGTIMTWSVKVGDSINEDDVLFDVSTAKVSAEIPSPVAGKILEILFKEGDTVPVGTVVAIVQLDGDDAADAAVDESTSTEKAKGTTDATKTDDKQAPAAVTSAPKAKAVKDDAERWNSPLVLQMAQDAKIGQEELNNIPGTGYLGRISKKDIEHYIEQKKKGATPAVATAAPQPTAGTKPVVAAEVPRTASPAAFVNVNKGGEGDQVVEMDRVRRIIADHMVMSKNVSAHVTSVVEVDVTKLVRWRERNKDAFFKREGVRLTYMPSIAEATTKALAEFPQVNASVDGHHIILKKHINLGIAVALNDGNLIVPVVHDADKLSLNGLGVAIDSLANKARSNKLMPDDIQGGTFTITNFGSFKGLFGTPIINQPQVAILAVGYIEKKPAVVETPEGDTIAIRHKMYLSLSYDHRIIDGSLGGNFLRRIADYLENWNA